MKFSERMAKMKLSKRIASIALVAVLSVAGLAAITLAASDGHRWGHSAWAKHDKHKQHGDKHTCSRDGDSDRGHHRPDPNELAKKLTVMETEIGIRSNQIDAWRDFTDALLATMAPGPKGPGGPGAMLPSDGEPFYLAEHLADRAAARGKSAEELKQAIAKLRTTLTAEQLDKVKEIEAQIRARFRAHHGPGHHGKGPHGKGPHGKGPHGMGPHGKGPHGGPPAASDSGPDEPAASDDGDDNDEEDEENEDDSL